MPVQLLKRTVSFCALFGAPCANYKQEMICVTFKNGSDSAARVDFFNHVSFCKFCVRKVGFLHAIGFLIRISVFRVFIREFWVVEDGFRMKVSVLVAHEDVT
ncbi:hypothetical protein NFG57_16395 [Halomonas sp. H10-59]|uniref:Secreted protein n=1 Tax=Halomonas sp. H10-59 TaxID=2950874 RepID=A0AAU7KSG6_9GAMM